MILFLLVIAYVSLLLFYTIRNLVFKGQWEYVVFFMLLYLPFYISILSIAYKATGSPFVVAVFQYLKEFVLVLGFCAFAVYQKDFFGYGFRLNIIDKLFIYFFGLATLYLFLPLGEATFFNKLLYLKNTLLIGAFYVLGRNTTFSNKEASTFFKGIMLIGIGAFVLNVFESFVSLHFQQITGYALFNYAINGVEPSGNYGLSWTFETQTTSMRLASFFSDPLELASSCLLAFSTGLIWYLTTSRKRGSFYLLAMLAAVGSLFFSASRAAFGAFFIMVFFIAVIFKLNRLLLLGALGLCGFVIYVIYFASDDFYYFVYDTITFQNASSLGHLIEWLVALDTMIISPEGVGLAMSGNTGSVEDEVRVGGENQFLIYGVQLGVIGMILYIAILSIGISKCIKVFHHSEDVYMARMAFVAGTTKFGLLLPLFTANAELYAYVSLLTWWMMGYTMTGYNSLFISRKGMVPSGA